MTWESFYINLQAWLCKSTPFFPIRKQGYIITLGTGMNLQQYSSAAGALIIWFLNRLSSQWADWTMVFTGALITHFLESVY